jgi:hypothetical protein
MQIYVSNERETKLRAYCKDKTISGVIAQWIDSLDNDLKQTYVNGTQIPEVTGLKAMCERQFCKVRSEGKYKVVTNEGTEEWIGNMCTFHWNQARKEGEVSDL